MISNGQELTTAVFVRALKKLNGKLRVCAFENESRLAGLYLINKQDEWEDICGVDKKYVPAYAAFDSGGHVVKSGWRRVFWILLSHGYTSRERVRRVCGGFFDGRACRADRFVGGNPGDPIQNKLMKYGLESLEKNDNALTTDQILDVAEMIRARDTQSQREERDHDKWFLEKWKHNGGGVNDRPNY